MKAVDKVFNNLAKTQKYLLWRIFLVVVLVISALDTVFNSAYVSDTLVFNTMLLLFAPLCLEYFLGMGTYSKLSNSSRWLGFISSFVMLVVCFFGYFGKVTIEIAQSTNFIEEIHFFGFPILNLIKINAYLITFVVVFDSLFSFSKRERYYYGMQKKLETYLDESYEELKKGSNIEIRVKNFKEELGSQL